jgi:hypothetical protein
VHIFILKRKVVEPHTYFACAAAAANTAAKARLQKQLWKNKSAGSEMLDGMQHTHPLAHLPKIAAAGPMGEGREEEKGMVVTAPPPTPASAMCPSTSAAPASLYQDDTGDMWQLGPKVRGRLYTIACALYFILFACMCTA